MRFNTKRKLSSLSNAVSYWVPSLSASSPSTPIVLVGCKSDMRNVHSSAHASKSSQHLPAQGSISSQKALAMSKHCGAVMYAETSAKTSERSSASAFEVAALACKGTVFSYLHNLLLFKDIQ
jgi:GTPase SAR1 family protein